jgi:hypothetical protein
MLILRFASQIILEALKVLCVLYRIVPEKTPSNIYDNVASIANQDHMAQCQYLHP